MALPYLVVVQQEVVNVVTLVVPCGAVLLGAAPEEDALWEHTPEEGGAGRGVVGDEAVGSLVKD